MFFFWSSRSLKEAFLRSFEYSDRQVTNVLLMIITVIAETLTSLLIVSTIVYLSQNLGLYFGFLSLDFVVLNFFLLNNCFPNFQESLFAKHLVVLATFPECEAIISFQILDALIYKSAVGFMRTKLLSFIPQ